ncbi:MAG TPA: dipeptide ABC transporter ATP-binding protein [Virgibacillus sp.]|nr:dipeptide ABC transporter ATP-binding protein [Virgibacillus sp.]
MSQTLLEIKNLKVHFPVQTSSFKKATQHVRAVDDINLSVNQGETLGVVGESGCGKSTLARTIIGLEKPTAGQILFEGIDLNQLNAKDMREVRRHIQMIFQDPLTSLNPRMKVGEIIAAPLKAYKVKTNIPSRVKELMELVGLHPDEHYDRLPHEFSGGQRQRIGIARAIAIEPKLLICDEPVSALDVSVQAQVINLLEDLQKALGLTYIFIAHDLSVVKHIADQIAVMYLGKIMELSNKNNFYKHAQHPYTNALLSAIPLPDPIQEQKRQQVVLEGELPSPIDPPTGCVFHTRCPFAQDACRENVPYLKKADEQTDHYIACFYPQRQQNIAITKK